MSNNIYKINEGLPLSTKISLLNSFILILNGMVQSGKFDKSELDQIFSDVSDIDRKFLRNVLLGNTLSDYTDWSNYYNTSGYSIWKLTPDNYAYNSLNQLYFDDILLDNRGEALSDALTGFDKVYLNGNESGADFTDNTTEALTENGTEFNVMSEIDDYLYVGLSSKFSGIDFIWQTRGSNYTNVVEYWNGSAWTTMTANLNNLDDATLNFVSNGKITFDQPTDWATTTVNSVASKYWIRISTTTVPTTTAKAYLVVPANSVISLLSLSSEQFQKEEYAWCSYNGSIYVTIKNTGVSAYEGDAFITSTSSTSNKQNFFIYNHEFKLDHEDSTYTGSTGVYSIESGAANGDIVYVSGANTFGLADATGNTKPAIGVVSDLSSEIVKFNGRVTVNTVGAADIVAGDVVFLSTTAGKVTKTPPESGSHIVQGIGRAIEAESGSQVDIILSIELIPVEWA